MLFLRSVAPPVQKSPVVFQKYADNYIHTFTQQSDTGLEMDLLQKYIFIPLDIFKENVENKGIKNKMDGGLTFLGMDEPEKIIELINTYPEFREMYEHVYYICRNVEDVMGIFSEELRIMNRNTVRYMVDEMQETIDEQKEMIVGQQEQLKKKDSEMQKMILEKDEKMKEKEHIIEELKKQIALLQK